MKKSHHMLVVAALACAGVLQIGSAVAQLKTQGHEIGSRPLSLFFS
jgi:hypothetical protein